MQKLRFSTKKTASDVDTIRTRGFYPMNVFSHFPNRLFMPLLALIVIVGLSTPTYAGFTDLNAGARSMGMGGAFVGLADDASAPLYNPAGIGSFQRMDLLFNYSSLYGGLTNGSLYSGYAGAVVPTASMGTFGLGFYQRGASVSSENLYTESVLVLNYAQQIKQLSLGMTVKSLISSWNSDRLINNDYLTDDGATAVDVDLGLLYHPFPNLSLGVAAENVIGADMAIGDNGEDKLDRVLKTGIAFRIGEQLSPYAPRFPATIVADVIYKMRNERDAVSRVQFGAEGWLIGDGLLALRAGYATGDEEYEAVTVGASFRLKPIHPGLQLDYGYQAPNEVKEVNTHRFALRFHNEPVIKQLDPSEVEIKLIAEPSMFSPNNDGRMDITTLRPIAPQDLEIESWSVRLYTRNTGDMVRSFEGVGRAPAELTWRGQDNNGTHLPDGEYYGVHDVTSLFSGSFNSPNTVIMLDTKPPEVFARVSPQTFMPLNEDGSLPSRATFRLSANDALSGTDAWSLYIRKDGTNENYRTFTGRGAPAEDITWDGTDDAGNINYEGGSYVYVLEAVDKVGNRAWTEPQQVFTSTRVRMGPSEGTLQMLHEKIFFDLDKATLKPQSLPVLDKVVNELAKFPEYSLVVSAHTCDLGSDEYNLELSQKRAESVMEYLQSHDAIQRVVEAKGYGESRPMVPNTGEENRKKNRRVEMFLVPRE